MHARRSCAFRACRVGNAELLAAALWCVMHFMCNYTGPSVLHTRCIYVLQA